MGNFGNYRKKDFKLGKWARAGKVELNTYKLMIFEKDIEGCIKIPHKRTF